MDESPDLEREVDDAMRLFEKAHVGTANALTPTRPSRVLLVLDGSPQDLTSINAALEMRKRFDTETLVLDARETVLTSSKNEGNDSSVAEALPSIANDAVAQVSGSRSVPQDQWESFEKILAALKKHDVNLVIVPCPFGRSFDQIGEDSVGTVVDVLLNRCTVPFLIIRRQDQEFAACSERVVVMVSGECDVENRAAAWAFGLASENAEVSLNLVVEKEHYENVRSIIETVRPGEAFDISMLSDALTKTHQGLHAAMSRTATEMKIDYYLQPQAGELAPPHPLTDNTVQLLVMPLEVDDRFTQGFVIDRIRRSPHPVLVVPGHVPTLES